MVEVLMQGTVREINCGHCNARLRYDIRTDIIEGSYLDAYTNKPQLKIVCPCCNEDIIIKGGS